MPKLVTSNEPYFPLREPFDVGFTVLFSPKQDIYERLGGREELEVLTSSFHLIYCWI